MIDDIRQKINEHENEMNEITEVSVSPDVFKDLKEKWARYPAQEDTPKIAGKELKVEPSLKNGFVVSYHAGHDWIGIPSSQEIENFVNRNLVVESHEDTYLDKLEFVGRCSIYAKPIDHDVNLDEEILSKQGVKRPEVEVDYEENKFQRETFGTRTVVTREAMVSSQVDFEKEAKESIKTSLQKTLRELTVDKNLEKDVNTSKKYYEREGEGIEIEEYKERYSGYLGTLRRLFETKILRKPRWRKSTKIIKCGTKTVYYDEFLWKSREDIEKTVNKLDKEK